MLRHTVWGLKPNFANTVGAGYSLQTGVGTRNGFLKNVVKISIFREKNVCLSYFSRIETQIKWSAQFRVHQLMLVIMYTNFFKISYACRSNYYRIRQCTQKGAHYMYIKLVCSLTKEITAKCFFKVK